MITLDDLISFKWLATVFSGFALYMAKSQINRLDKLEEEMKNKLDKNDYQADQTDVKQDMRELRKMISEIPNQVVMLLRDSGKI